MPKEHVGLDGLSKRQSMYLGMAMYTAGFSQERQRHGAVIVKNGNIVASEVNKFRNDPNYVVSETRGIYSVHAEAAALKAAGPAARGATLYVARINSKDEPLLSRPCNNCYEAAVEAGVKIIIST